MSIYKEMVEAGVENSSHESDLYVPVNMVTTQLVEAYEHKNNVTMFTSNIDGKRWYDIPFAFDPYWESKGFNCS